MRCSNPCRVVRASCLVRVISDCHWWLATVRKRERKTKRAQRAALGRSLPGGAAGGNNKHQAGTSPQIEMDNGEETHLAPRTGPPALVVLDQQMRTPDLALWLLLLLLLLLLTRRRVVLGHVDLELVDVGARGRLPARGLGGAVKVVGQVLGLRVADFPVFGETGFDGLEGGKGGVSSVVLDVASGGLTCVGHYDGFGGGCSGDWFVGRFCKSTMRFVVSKLVVEYNTVGGHSLVAVAMSTGRRRFRRNCDSRDQPARGIVTYLELRR